jgi:hypothetical protein
MDGDTRMTMTVKKLIAELEKVENKMQEIDIYTSGQLGHCGIRNLQINPGKKPLLFLDVDKL